MDSTQLQRILVALDECCELTQSNLTIVDNDIDAWLNNILNCCALMDEKADEIIEILEDWAAEYSGTYDRFKCVEINPADIRYEITFSDYECQYIAGTTTSTTTIDPDFVDFRITFTDYECQKVYDSSVTDTTTVEEKSGEILWSATYDSFKCEEEYSAYGTTTTSTTYTTTTATTVDPEDVEFTATYDEFSCEMVDNPLYTTSTTTEAPIDEDDIDWSIQFSDYQCQTIYQTTTTSTTIVPTTTTTTTFSYEQCGVELSGNSSFAEWKFVRVIDLGTNTGVVGLYIDTVDAPDKYTVEWNGSEVINTGYQGNPDFYSLLQTSLASHGEPNEVIVSPRESVFTFEKTTSERWATVTVYAPIEETIWSFEVKCPSEATTTTTSDEVSWSATYDYFKCEETGSEATTTTTIVPTTTTTTTPIPVYEITCGEEASGIVGYPQVIYLVSLGASSGYVTLTYDTEALPDKFVVEIDGVEVANTGYVGDLALQPTLDEALTALGQPTETIVGNATGVLTFYKSSSTVKAVCKVYAPIPETEWSFTLSCPDDYTTTSTTTLPPTTTTTTIPPTTTTTTTNAPPESIDNLVVNTRSTCTSQIQLYPSNFTFTDLDGDDLNRVRINSYTGAGTLTYNGLTVNNGDTLLVIGGATGSFQHALIYTPDGTQTDPYTFTINFSVRTDNNVDFG